jgi:HTH-type transcriptional regulator/antitoxin HigA
MTTFTPKFYKHWATVGPLLSIRNEQEYDAAITRLGELLDEIGENEAHPLYSFLEALTAVVETYEAQHHSIPESTGAEALQYLMEEHGLAQANLHEIGSQGVVSEIINGKRELNVRHIRALAKRFKVSPAVFM